MDTKPIPLSHLAADPEGTLTECYETGQPLLIELPGRRFVTIQPLDPAGEDDLTDHLLAANIEFQALVEKSKSDPRKPFTLSEGV